MTNADLLKKNQRNQLARTMGTLAFIQIRKRVCMQLQTGNSD